MSESTAYLASLKAADRGAVALPWPALRASLAGPPKVVLDALEPPLAALIAHIFARFAARCVRVFRPYTQRAMPCYFLPMDTQQRQSLDPLRQRRRVYRSRLDRHRAELVARHRAGASLAELVDWLADERRCRVQRSTVLRALRGWPEVADA